MPDQRCKGLAVRVAPSGVKTWDLAYRIRGTAKTRRLSLGRTTDVSLEQARERANELTSAARGGRDLIAEEGEAHAAAASRVTIGSLIDLYLRRRVAGRLRTANEIESRLRRTLAPILPRYAADICRRDIRELLDAMVDRGKGREAEKRRQICKGMFRWALSQDIVETDPTDGLRAYDPGTPRDRVLTVEEIETKMTIYGFIENPELKADLNNVADTLFGKNGGITSYEAAATDTPLLGDFLGHRASWEHFNNSVLLNINIGDKVISKKELIPKLKTMLERGKEKRRTGKKIHDCFSSFTPTPNVYAKLIARMIEKGKKNTILKNNRRRWKLAKVNIAS